MYIGGKQARPDSGYSRPVYGPAGELVGEVGDGNRKDIRNAVEAARGALGWGTTTAHTRAQILYFLAENLEYRPDEFANRLRAQTGESLASAQKEVAASVERLFAFAGWADKYDGAVHNPPSRTIAVAMVEPIGVMGIVAPPSRPLLGSIALIAPALAMGNPVVLVPSETSPLSVTDLYQVIETSDVPVGRHQHRHRRRRRRSPRPSPSMTASMRCGSPATPRPRPWSRRPASAISSRPGPAAASTTTSADKAKFEGDYFLRRATQVKNVWVPYGAAGHGRSCAPTSPLGRSVSYRLTPRYCSATSLAVPPPDAGG